MGLSRIPAELFKLVRVNVVDEGLNSDQLQRLDDDTFMLKILNIGLRKFCCETKCIQKIGEVTTNASGEVALPTDFWQTKDRCYRKTDGVPLRKVNLDIIERKRTESSSDPVYFTVYGGLLRTAPLKSGIVIRLPYFAYPPEIIDKTAEIPASVPQRAIDAVVEFLTGKGWKAMEDMEQATAGITLFQNEIDEADFDEDGAIGFEDRFNPRSLGYY